MLLSHFGRVRSSSGFVRSSMRSATTYGCVSRHVSGRNFMTDMNLPKLWTSVFWYSLCTMPER